MTRYCLALDLKDDPKLIAEYEYWHQTKNGWPEVKKSILDAGITDMQIYRTGNRFQQPLPWAAEGEKWVLMNKVFQL